MIRRISIFVSLMMCALPLRAQTVPFVNFADNSRRMALGGADAAYTVSRVLDSGIRGMVDATYMMWQPKALDCKVLMLDGLARLGRSSVLSAGVKYNRLNPVPLTDSQGVSAGTYTPSEYVAYLGFAFAATDKLALMAELNLISSNLTANFAGSAIAADLGVAYDINGYRLALMARNLGSELKYAKAYSAKLPTTVTFGVEKNFTLWNNGLTIAADAGYMPAHSCLVAKVGMEFSLLHIVDLRVGYHYGSAASVEPAYATVGIGANIKVLRIGAAYYIADSDSPLKNTLALSLGAKF